jgi:predicted TIM-barrel fold metal-dependent hydrolase
MRFAIETNRAMAIPEADKEKILSNNAKHLLELK